MDVAKNRIHLTLQVIKLYALHTAVAIGHALRRKAFVTTFGEGFLIAGFIKSTGSLVCLDSICARLSSVWLVAIVRKHRGQMESNDPSWFRR